MGKAVLPETNLTKFTNLSLLPIEFLRKLPVMTRFYAASELRNPLHLHVCNLFLEPVEISEEQNQVKDQIKKRIFAPELVHSCAGRQILITFLFLPFELARQFPCDTLANTGLNTCFVSITPQTGIT